MFVVKRVSRNGSVWFFGGLNEWAGPLWVAAMDDAVKYSSYDEAAMALLAVTGDQWHFDVVEVKE